MERTFAIIKPDAVKAGVTGRILARIESEGFRIVAMRQQHLTKAEAEGFYAVHKERPFFGELVDFITGGPVVVMALEGPEAIAVARKLMGKTKFTEAEPGTIRGDYAHDLSANLVHGSDSPESAARELKLFFGQ